MSNNVRSRKRPPPPQQPSPANQPQPRQRAATQEEDEFLDEDVFLDETLLETEDDLILRDIEQRQSLASRIAKWARPPLSDAYKSAAKNIRQSFPPIPNCFNLFCSHNFRSFLVI